MGTFVTPGVPEDCPAEGQQIAVKAKHRSAFSPMFSSNNPDGQPTRTSRILATWIDKLLSGDPVAADLSQGAPPVDPRQL